MTSVAGSLDYHRNNTGSEPAPSGGGGAGDLRDGRADSLLRLKAAEGNRKMYLRVPSEGEKEEKKARRLLLLLHYKI